MTDLVLIVDDSLTVRMDLTEAFDRAGFKSRPCATLAEARAALADGAVRVVVLDVMLPDGDGIDLLREIRATSSERPVAVLMLSSETEVKDRLRGLKTGADDYLGKPYDSDYVIAKVRELIRAQPAPKPDAPAVLLIDDSATFRAALQEALETAGYSVLTASTGEEGLRVAAGHRPAAVIVDGVMPGIDGATVIRRIRLDVALRGTACLMLTGSEDDGTELRAFDAGADAFVRKGEDPALILARLAAMLRNASIAEGSTTASFLGPKKILAVDDSATYLDGLAQALRDESYEVIIGRSGEEALELLGVQMVDCILLDLVMPGLGGQETCRRIKAAPMMRDVPLIVLSSLEDREAMVASLAAGADDYVLKSSEIEVLKARIRAQLRRKQFEDESRRIRVEFLQRQMEAAEARSARALAETRARLLEQLEQKNRELEAFSYSVSHDLRAPLRAIEGFGRMLLEGYAQGLDESGQHYLRRICAGAQRMNQLIEDILRLSRVERADLRRTKVDLAEVARPIVSDLQQRDPPRNVAVSIEGPLPVQADKNLMRIVLENLLGNAWKFTGKREEASIAVGREMTDQGPAFFVRDNGAGFDMTYAGKLFTPFQRLHKAGDFEGTGIGLTIVQRIVSRHGGRIWTKSAVDAGATFFFTVPDEEVETVRGASEARPADGR